MPRRRHVAAFLALAIAAVSSAGCGDGGSNFSQYPGFAEYFAANPPSTEPPAEADRALLRRYRPRVFVPDGHEGPIHFYDDYIAQGRLIGASEDGGRSTPVDRATLNRVKDDPGIVFEHAATGKAPTPTLFARIDRETVASPVDPAQRLRFTFLTYHAVFRYSGLPAGLPGWQDTLLGLIASTDDWHQLDHYTAVTIALDQSQRPVAVTFQQHNYLRTYLIGRDLALPADGRIKIDVAMRSNELYPHRPGRHVRRAVGFLNEGSATYLITGRDKPFRAADDITDSVREIDTALEFLPPADAFYTFKGFLGERRWLPGRAGPPGADYNTLPRFKPKVAQMMAFHWRENDRLYLSEIRNLRTSSYDRIAERFFREWDCARRRIVVACADTGPPRL